MAISRIQAFGDGTSQGPTYTLNFGVAPQAGNLLVVCLSVLNGPINSVPAGWSTALSISPTLLNSGTFGIYYFENCSSSTGPFEWGFSANGFPAAVIYEYSGIATSGSLDRTISNEGSSTVFDTGTTAATTQNDEAAIAFFGYTANDALIDDVFSNGFTYRAFGLDGDIASLLISADKILSSTGAQNTTWTTIGAAYVGAIATFKQAGGGGGGPGTPLGSSPPFFGNQCLLSPTGTIWKF
jgi:hypothetical protein